MLLPMTKEELYSMHYELNMTYIEIAKKYNISSSGVANIMKHYGLKACKRHVKAPIRDRYGKISVLGSCGYKYSEEERFRCQCDCGFTFNTTFRKLIGRKIEGCVKCSKGNYIEEISGSYWASIKCRRKKNQEFNITREYIWKLFLQQNRKCIHSGVELQFGGRKYNSKECTASLDRIDSSKGYTIGNVQWVHKWVNLMKQDMTDPEFINWCALITNHNKLGVNN